MLGGLEGALFEEVPLGGPDGMPVIYFVLPDAAMDDLDREIGAPLRRVGSLPEVDRRALLDGLRIQPFADLAELPAVSPPGAVRPPLDGLSTRDQLRVPSLSELTDDNDAGRP